MDIEFLFFIISCDKKTVFEKFIMHIGGLLLLKCFLFLSSFPIPKIYF